MNGRQILRTAIRRNRRALVAGTVLMTGYQLAETAVPVVLGLTTGHLLQRGMTGAAIGVALLGVTLLTVSMCWRFGMRILQRANTTEAHRLRVRVADRVIRPVPPRTDLTSGQVLTIGTDDADQTADIIEVVPLLVSSLLAVVVTAGLLAWIDIPLGLLIVVGTPVTLAVLGVLARRIGEATREQQSRVAVATARVADLIAGLRPLHGFGGNRAAFDGYRVVSRRAAGQAVGVARVSGAYAGAALLLNLALAVAVTLTAGWFALIGRISVAELVMAVGLSQFIIEPIKLFSEMPKYVATARASADRLALVLDAEPRFADGDGTAPQAPALELRDVRAPGLGLSVRIEPGEFVAVVGYQPGLGRALGDLLELRLPPAEYGGEVLLGGLPLASLSAESVRATVLAPSHHDAVFSGTLRENVMLAPRRPGTETFERAAEAALLGDVIDLHPAGADQVIRDRGANLSGGQRQRLSLARALATDPEILVLDDPTSAVDAVTEQMIASNLVRTRTGRTTVVVTAAPALLDLADRVIVVDGGSVVAEGTHRSLAAGQDYRLAVAR
ncbi:ABC transporter ATP-binding protein [Tsukamurella serpentis]